MSVYSGPINMVPQLQKRMALEWRALEEAAGSNLTLALLKEEPVLLLQSYLASD